MPAPPDSPPLTLSPQRQKQKTQEALVAWFLEEAEQNAVYAIWEDLHWADSSTLEVLSLFLDQLPTARILAVLTYRPEFSPPWPMRSHMTQFTLGRLGQAQMAAMVTTVTGGKPLPRELMAEVARKTDGIPLFVEEFTKMIVESDWLHETDGQYALTGPLPTLSTQHVTGFLNGAFGPAGDRQSRRSTGGNYWAGVLVCPPCSNFAGK